MENCHFEKIAKLIKIYGWFLAFYWFKKSSQEKKLASSCLKFDLFQN